jgi:hypothetical protein
MKQMISAIGLVLCLYVGGALQAQSVPDRFERGLYLGGTIGDTNMRDDRASWLVRPFIRHSIARLWDGEVSIGVGMLNSTEYRTRVIPVDYTVHLYPFRVGDVRSRGVVRGSDLFVFGGFGLLNYHHTNVLFYNETIEAHTITWVVGQGLHERYGFETGSQYVKTHKLLYVK